MLKKYNDADIVEKITSKTIWVGETIEQLEDSLGKPSFVSQKVQNGVLMRQTYKYFPVRKNAYKVKVEVRDGKVTGWDV